MTSKIVNEVALTVHFSVTEWEMDDGSFKYDWVASNGDESAELFDTAEEAKESGLQNFGH